MDADWWPEDWAGSCTCAGNPDPDGRPQGLSVVDVPGAGPVTLASLASAWPAEMGRTDVLVKLLSPSGPVPLHPHPTRAWARRHLGPPYRRTEAWILYVAHAGVPRYLGPRLAFIEVQEPSDHIVIPETSGADDAGATMGPGWELALDMIDYDACDAAATFARARRQPRVLRASGGSLEVRLVQDDVLEFFDVTALEVADEIEVAGGRFPIAVVVAGDGWAEGEFGREPIGRGQTFAWPASLALRVRADREPVRIVRCMGPEEAV